MKDDILDFLPVAIVSLVILGVGLVFGASAAKKAWRQEAVKQGVAEFRADEKGNVTFHWLPRK